jgi:hypothetical protein
MPTLRPRYTLTDTGKLGQALDVAAERWPGRSRRELLDLLVRAGQEQTQAELRDGARRARARRTALTAIRRRADFAAIRDDQAWR